MDWRAAKCLLMLRTQVDELFPTRDKSSDGIRGDQRHAATKSEHNPDSNGVVRAMDITHDPAHGLNARALAEALVASKDPRIIYLISNRQIISSKVSPWEWRPYSGVNAHEHHMHISVVEDPRLYDDEHRWAFEMTAPPPVETSRAFTNITATVFGGAGDEQPVAYADVKAGWPDRPGCAFPYRFTGLPRRLVRVTNPANGKSIECEIVDVGPWYPSKRGPADPYWLTNSRPRAEADPNTNGAGIDLTPAAAKAIGLDGKGVVSWQFVTPQSTPTPSTPQEGRVDPATPPSTPVKKDATVTTPAVVPTSTGFNPLELLSSLSADKIAGVIDNGSLFVSIGSRFLPPEWQHVANELLERAPEIELLVRLEHAAATMDGAAVKKAQAAAARAWADKQDPLPAAADVAGRVQ